MLNTEKHRQIMYMILKDIFNSNLWKYLAFKWWTNCYFLHWLDRFSTDLDFDLLKNLENIDDEIILILKKYWSVKKWKKIILSYWEQDINIKIDISINIWNNNTYEIVNFYWTNIKVQDKSTIFANKLVALIERNTNRDIYDVYFMFKNIFDINYKVIYERTGLDLNDIFLKIKSKLEKLPKNYKILDGLWEVLNEKQKFFVKHNLVKELISILDYKINFK